MKMFCILTISVNVPIVILHYSFARYRHWRKLKKWYMGFLIISYKCLYIHNYLKIAKANLKYYYSLMYNNVNLDKVTVWTWVKLLNPWIHHLLYGMGRFSILLFLSQIWRGWICEIFMNICNLLNCRISILKF